MVIAPTMGRGSSGGGFIMGKELPLLTAKLENVKAMEDFTREYGMYR